MSRTAKLPVDVVHILAQDEVACDVGGQLYGYKPSSLPCPDSGLCTVNMGLSGFLRPALRMTASHRVYMTMLPRHMSMPLHRPSSSLFLNKVNLASISSMSKSQFSQLFLEMLCESGLESSEDDEGGMKRGKETSAS